MNNLSSSVTSGPLLSVANLKCFFSSCP
jgi:hypothetical protein